MGLTPFAPRATPIAMAVFQGFGMRPMPSYPTHTLLTLFFRVVPQRTHHGVVGRGVWNLPGGAIESCVV